MRSQPFPALDRNDRIRLPQPPVFRPDLLTQGTQQPLLRRGGRPVETETLRSFRRPRPASSAERIAHRSSESPNRFTRKRMSVLQRNPLVLVEGYWGQSADDITEFPWPRPYLHGSWPEKGVFLERLAAIEGSLAAAGRLRQYRGLAPSRLDPGEMVGSGEFVDETNGVVWPEGYAQHYVDRHNVLPSEQFYDYVMHFQPTDPNVRLREWHQRWRTSTFRDWPWFIKRVAARENGVRPPH